MVAAMVKPVGLSKLNEVKATFTRGLITTRETSSLDSCK